MLLDLGDWDWLAGDFEVVCNCFSPRFLSYNRRLFGIFGGLMFHFDWAPPKVGQVMRTHFLHVYWLMEEVELTTEIVY